MNIPGLENAEMQYMYVYFPIYNEEKKDLDYDVKIVDTEASVFDIAKKCRQGLAKYECGKYACLTVLGKDREGNFSNAVVSISELLRWDRYAMD